MKSTARAQIAVLAALMFCAGIASGLDWRALLLLKLVPVAAALDWLRVASEPGRYRWWIGLGLVLSLLGDALLALPQDRFILGLVAFLCAHPAYVAGYFGRSCAFAAGWLAVALLLVASRRDRRDVVAGRCFVAVGPGRSLGVARGGLICRQRCSLGVEPLCRP